MMFVLDSSGSINPGDYKQMKRFLDVVADKMQIGVENADGEIIGQGAMVTFSEKAKVEINLRASRTTQAFEDAVAYLKGPVPGGRTYTDKGLKLAEIDVAQPSAGLREGEDVKRILVVLTDGEQTKPGKGKYTPVSQAIQPFYKKDIEVFAVGVGLKKENAIEEVKSMVPATKQSTNAIFPGSYTELIESVNDFISKFCPGAVIKQFITKLH